jgi:stage II sporulation protein P
MRRKTGAARQAALYLLLLAITPFVCSALLRSFPAPAALIENAAMDSARFQAGALTITDSELQTEDEPVTPASVQKALPKKLSFRIITDDSFITGGDEHLLPSSRNEEAAVSPDLENETAEADNTPGADDSALSGIVDIVTYGQMTGNEYINLDVAGQIRNMTDISYDTIESTADKLPGVTLKRDGSPEILIYHTHATESYLPAASGRFDPDYPFRSSDESINMVAVGNAITDKLREAGFGVIHDSSLYDETSYNGSYELSRAGVQEILAENPGIKIVLDVHRDALVKSDTEIVAPTVTIDGKDSAQVMIVSNCDGDSLKYPIPNYSENLKLAALIDRAAEEKYPGLMRPILFDYRQYNQDLSPGALLIEVGGHGNSLDQAVYAGELFGNGLADALVTLVK